MSGTRSVSMRERRAQAIARAIAPRPRWNLRGALDPARGEEGPMLMLGLPRGLAATPEDALAVAQREWPDVMRQLPASRWRAYPVLHGAPMLPRVPGG
ncbi:MAG: hypothetical protein KJZ47_15015 [Gemmatimonadales bacterium]|nr:hypothetical protein [Gemmatimonadales bacterium]